MQKTGIVIPCYNEANRLDLKQYENFLKHEPDFVLCFVDDGSGDNTFQLLQNLAQSFTDRTRLVKNKTNLGKAEAVRAGINALLNEPSIAYIGYLDADLASSFEQFKVICEKLLNSENLRMVMASRVQLLGSYIHRKPFRHYMGRIYATVVSLILGIDVYDTQCGAKVLRAANARKVFEKPFLTRWGFDAELISRLIKDVKRTDIQKYIIEQPIEHWQDKRGSKIGFFDYFIILYDLLKLAYLKIKEG